MSKKGMTPTGSIVKGSIESALMATTELEQSLIGIMSISEIEAPSGRTSAVGEIFPYVAKIEYFSNEVWDFCAGTIMEEPALFLRQSVGDLRDNLVAAIQSLNSTGFARSLGQMLLSTGGIKTALADLEKERFKRSKMRRP